jgi:DNA-directed RNA polymerase, mitochondrial
LISPPSSTHPYIIDLKKQATSFPPNLIHSLDATHMFLTALRATDHNLTFASVHDSFYTHPSDMDSLARILRDEFVNLYSTPVLQNLRDDLVQRYAGYIIPTDSSASTRRRRRVWPSPIGVLSRLQGRRIGKDIPTVSPVEEGREGWRNISLPPLPRMGDFDINSVKDSLYFFN